MGFGNLVCPALHDFSHFERRFQPLEGKVFPTRLLRGALPLPAGTPRNAPCPGCPAHSLTRHQQPRRPCQIRSSPWLAASSQLVTCEAPSFHCRSNAGGGMECPPPPFHLADILGESSSPAGRWCSCQPRLGSLRCARLGSWDVPQRAKDKGCPRVCRMRAAPASPCSLPCSAARASPPLILCFMHCGSFNPSFCFGF